jgi:hypothetical protein
MKTDFEHIQKAVEILNNKFSKIKDFKLRQVWHHAGNIQGGFYWMNYDNTPSGSYPFHEIFFKEIANWSTEEIVDKISVRVIEKLKWQKWCDESIAEETNKEVQYEFDYAYFGL